MQMSSGYTGSKPLVLSSNKIFLGFISWDANALSECWSWAETSLALPDGGESQSLVWLDEMFLLFKV